MASFSIDDVRDTLQADITRLLARIEESAHVLADVPEPPSLEEGPSFRAIGDHGHAVYGTCALVDAESLAIAARCLEKVAARGEEEVRLAAAHLAVARKLAAIATQGASGMREMLGLELERRGDEAQWIALAWCGVAEEAIAHFGSNGAIATNGAHAAAEATVDPSDLETPTYPFVDVAGDDAAGAIGGTELVFEDGPGVNDDAGDAIQKELAEVFQLEAREMVVALQGHLATLSADPSSSAPMGPIERLFHTLKGAAATVGLGAIRDDASELQHRVEAMLESGGKATRESVDVLVADANRMLARAQLPAIVLPSNAENAEDVSLPARALFLEEARGVHADAVALFRELGRESASRRDGDVHAELASLLHRLKGSAAVVAYDTIAGEAAALHDLVTSEGASSAHALLGDGLARIGRFIGADVASSLAHARDAEPTGAQREAVVLPAEPELWRAFTLECNEILDTLERETLDVEHSDTPKERLRGLMRHYHTLKGVVNTMGLTPTGAVIHRVEDLLEAILERAVLPSMRDLVSLLLQAQGEVRKNLRQAQDGYVETSLGTIDARAAKLLGQGMVDDRSRSGETEGSMHAGASAASAADGQASPGTNDASDRRFIKVATERLDILMNLAGELVVSRSRLLGKVTDLRALQTELGRGSKRIVDTVEAFRRDNEFANLDGRGALPQPIVPPLPAILRRSDDVSQPAAFSGFTDLELDRYDDVHVLSRSLAEITSDFQELYTQFQRGVATLTDDSDAFGGIISGIQNEVTRARMVPLEFLFARLRLPIRDAATRDGKEVRVVTHGEDVAIDKTIADALFQPMLHLVRNAVAHGVERASQREKQGKQAAGTITLSARQESGQIVIEVKDDGAGLDLDALRARGIAMGLIGNDVSASEQAIKELVFAPQLSTQRDAGAIAGRGVGCDVVRRAIERLNGTIRVDTERGKGTAFAVTLPITLAITKALIVRHRKQVFALPLYFAERIIEAQEQRIVDSAGHRRIKVDDAFVPVRPLGEVLFGVQGGECEGPVVVLRVGDQRLTLQVDAVLGQEEIVVKNLGTLLAGHPLFAGVSLRGTGELVLIVDVPELVDTRGSTARALVAPSQGSREVSPSPLHVDAPEARTRLHVLFVDDSLSVRKVAEMNLKALGVDVTLAVDGLDALNKLRESTFDLVFTDLEMPRMHGYELIRELRFLPAYADLPILVVTSRSGQKHQDQARALGATEYMTKPFTRQSLEAAMRRWGKIRSGKGASSAQRNRT